ncbi:hypothetical protein MSAN_02200700 [Mycena sanguinolenta]|uniref:Uncharacterized protein n=1 Tax=Mycena sanguinolenta TaxID=230812 RepID=A0A8H6XDY2_9AGAR|nr:hypothetical protein MSAN_02200700 [Mycena sanguinolenta]
MSLPQELVDAILDNISDDLPTLKACSLVASLFTHSARTHIYRKIEISPLSSSGNSCRKFYELLSSSPDIAPLVKNLLIVSNGLFPTDAEECRRGKLGFEPDTSRTLPLVLPCLVNLTRISLVEHPPNPWIKTACSMNWRAMNEDSKSALAAVFSSPRLEAVHFRGFAIESPRQLLSLFSEAVALKEMSLSRMYFTSPEPWPKLQPWLPQLQSLRINDSGRRVPYLRYFVHPQICLSQVSTLSVNTHSIQWRNEIIQATGVEHLQVMLRGPTECTPDIFCGMKLRSIHLWTDCTLYVLAHVFIMCQPGRALERITIDGPGTDWELSLLRLSNLDVSIETKLDHLPALKRVELRREKEGTDAVDTFAKWEVAVQAALPSLMRRGMLFMTEIDSAARHEWE